MSCGGGGVHLLSGVGGSHRLWVEGGTGGGGGSAEVRGFNPHVFDWPTVCEGMCLVRVLFTNQVG